MGKKQTEKLNIRNDAEKYYSDTEINKLIEYFSETFKCDKLDTTIRVEPEVIRADLKNYIEGYFEKFAHYKVIITDRYHGTIFSLISNTPVIVIKTKDHKEYRDAYGMFAVNGILFNHESERRGENFVTRKITLAAGRIAEGLQDHLELGNMDSLRDWGYAKDYVECMWLIMQQEKPEDFVIATGVQHTVRDFTEKAFAANGMTIRWEGMQR